MKTNLISKIIDNLEQRMATHIDSRCATDDEVSLAACICEIESLRRISSEVHALAVCATITPTEDMAHIFSRIIEITSPDYEEGKA